MTRSIDLFEAAARGFIPASRGRTIVFWIATVWVLFDVLIAGMLDFLRIPHLTRSSPACSASCPGRYNRDRAARSRRAELGCS